MNLVSVFQKKAPQPQPVSAGTESYSTLTNKYEGQDRWVASACYIYFISAAVLVLRHDNTEFVNLHAKQALVFLLAGVLVFIFAPGLLWKLVFNSIILMMSIYGAYQAWEGNRWTIPYLTDLANSVDI